MFTTLKGMHFCIFICLQDNFFGIYLVPVNNLKPMKNCPGSRVQVGRIGLISRQPNINIVFFRLDSDFLSHNSFE